VGTLFWRPTSEERNKRCQEKERITCLTPLLKVKRHNRDTAIVENISTNKRKNTAIFCVEGDIMEWVN